MQNFQPVRKVVKSVFLGHVIDENPSIGALAILREQESKPFLAAKVPDLDFNAFPVNFKFLNVKLHPVVRCWLSLKTPVR